MYDIKYIIRLLKEYLEGKSPELQNRTECIKGCQRLIDCRKDLKTLSLPLPFPRPPSRTGHCEKQAHLDGSQYCRM